MITVEGASADDVWRQVAARMQRDGVVQQSRDQPTRELVHVAVTLTDPRQRVVFARAINPAFALADVLWVLAGANDADFLQFWNRRMATYTDDNNPHVLHGAYGYRLGSQPMLSQATATRLRHVHPGDLPRLDQLKAAAEALRHTPHSRQVVLHIWDAARDLPAPEPRSRDVPCNVMSHLMLRSGRLEWLQIMRSNDLVWGLPYNIIQFTSMQEMVAGWLGVDVGTYVHISDSLHVYERHWPLLNALTDVAAPVPHNEDDLRIDSYDAWETLWSRLLDGALALTEQPDTDSLLGIAAGLGDLPAAYHPWVAVLTAEALRRREHYAAADEMGAQAGPYWGASWRLWRAARPSREEPVG